MVFEEEPSTLLFVCRRRGNLYWVCESGCIISLLWGVLKDVHNLFELCIQDCPCTVPPRPRFVKCCGWQKQSGRSSWRAKKTCTALKCVSGFKGY